MTTNNSISHRDPSFGARASRHASQTSQSHRSTQSNFTGFMKSTVLPPHVEEVLHGRRRAELRCRQITGQGLYTTQGLMPGLDRKVKQLPWEKGSSTPKQSRSSDSLQATVVRSKTQFGRQRKVTKHSSYLGPNKYMKLYEIIEGNAHKKITFTNSNEPMEMIPNWVTHRLQDSCRSARFALPSDYRRLEDITPTEYLEKYTVLNRSQRRRYDKIFAKYMDKQEKCIMSDRLYPALNSMFANSLGHENFDILCIALFLYDYGNIHSKDLFAGICAFTERLFWSSYLDNNENTFFHLGPNRSLLECADFNGLQWKLENLEISVEMRALLNSLA